MRKSALNHGYKAITIQDGHAVTLLDLRVYLPKDVFYAAVWVQCNKHVSGTGKAGGYGYHKLSAAVADALQSAGYSFSEEVSGVGHDAVVRAIKAVCRLHGHTDVHVIEMVP